MEVLRDSGHRVRSWQRHPVHKIKQGYAYVIAGKPVLTFDTSVHNRLVDDGEKSDSIFARLKDGYFVRLAGLAIEEIIATPDRSERAALLQGFSRLRCGAHDCLLPNNELLRQLIRAHESDGAKFDWRSVNVTSPEYASGTSDHDLIADDQLSEQQRLHLMEQKKAFEKPFSDLRPKLDKILRKHKEPHPLSFREVLPQIRPEGGLVCGFAKALYERGGWSSLSDVSIGDFMDRCPPFRAAVYGLLLAWYDRSLGDRHNREKFQAGRIDIFMAVYLPYCDQFITAEEHGEQERCLQEVAFAADINTHVRSYDDFCNGLLLPH